MNNNINLPLSVCTICKCFFFLFFWGGAGGSLFLLKDNGMYCFVYRDTGPQLEGLSRGVYKQRFKAPAGHLIM